MRKSYPTDLTDSEWEIVKPFVQSRYQKGKSGREPTVDKREVVNAIFYVLQSGCSWRMLPHDFPQWESLYWYFKQWKGNGVTEKLHDFLREEIRKKVGKKADPTVGIADSQSVKTTEKGGSKAMMVANIIKVRKRHLLVDTLGLVLSVFVSRGNLGEREGVRVVFRRALNKWIKLVKVFVDGGYEGVEFEYMFQ